MSNIEDAFHKICKGFQIPDSYYVSLYERIQRYGGPEEGGWWTTDVHLRAFKEFNILRLAEEAKNRVEKFAKKLTKDARSRHGKQCLKELDYCEERGIDDSNSVFGEVDGPEEFFVVVENKPGSRESMGPTRYE